MKPFEVCFVLLSLWCSLTHARGSNAKGTDDKVLLRNIKTLTLRNGRMTSHRRVAAVPQLTCVGNACNYHKVDVMRCENVGSDYDENNVQWTCRAEVPDDFQLGSTDVICEGYSSSKDPYVLKGSCGVEYRLLLTPKGEDRYGKDGKRKDRDSNGGDESNYFAIFFWILFFSVVAWMIYKFRSNRTIQRAPHFPRSGGNNPGGNGPSNDDDDNDDNDNPPPPYTPYQDNPKPSSSSQANQRFQPGFGTGVGVGAAAGGAAGYMYGRNERSRLEEQLRQERERRDMEDRLRQDRELERERERRRDREWERDRGRFRNFPRQNTGSDSDSSSRGGTNYYTSTGFGETQNR